MGQVYRPPSEWDEERLRPGVLEFRCQICEGRYPMRLMVIEDGARVCEPNCASKMSKTELAKQLAEAHSLAARKTRDAKRPPFPPGSLIADLAFLTSVTWSGGAWPYQPVELSRGGAAVAVTLGGSGFSASDVIAYSDGITDAASPVVTATEITLSIEAAAGMISGYYDLTFNGNPWRRVLRVR